MGVFVYLFVFIFYFFEQVYLCVDFSVWMCLCASEEKEEDEKLLSFVELGEERKKRSEWEISKIINGRAIVTVYIYTITVARVEIYTFLHNFRRTDVEHF